MSKANGRSAKAPPPKTRVCKYCGKRKAITLFKKAATGKFAHSCKARDAARARQRYWADITETRSRRRRARPADPERFRRQGRARYRHDLEKERECARERRRTDRGREINRRAVERYRKAHPEIIAAQHAAQRAARRGELKVSLVCEIKGCRETEGLHLHHVDYRRPRDTIRACRHHHEHVHHRGPLELKPGGSRKWAREPRTYARAPD